MSIKKKNEFNILFNSSYWTAKEGLAFAKFESLCKLQSKNGLSNDENYIEIMGCRMHIKGRFLAYSSDGSTDAGIREKEIFYCHYVKEGNPTTKFLGKPHLEHTHADAKLTAIKKAICKHLDNTEMTYQKDVGCKFENVSVLSGCQGSSRTKMQEKQPNISFTHCIAHKLELAVPIVTARSGCHLP